MALKEKTEENLAKERPSEVPVEEVLSVQEESPSEEDSTLMITSKVTGKVEGKAGLVEVMNGFIKEDDETQKEEIEIKFETGAPLLLRRRAKQL